MYASYATAQTNFPKKERYIFLWDVSKSLLPKDGGIDEYTQQRLVGYPGSNGLWMGLKKGLINNVDSIEPNKHSKIIVIPFYAEPFEPFIANADNQGKSDIIKQIKEFEYDDVVHARDPHTNKLRTNIISALSKFEDIVKEDCLDYVNYLYLFTDGAHENQDAKTTDTEWQELTKKIKDFDNYANTNNRYIYRFYYLVSDAADPYKHIKKLDSYYRRFWTVEGTPVVKHIKLKTTTVTYNVCDNPIKNIKRDENKKIDFDKNYGSCIGNIAFTPTKNDYYDVKCEIPSDSLSIVIKVEPKKDLSDLPEEFEIIVKAELERDKNHPYCFLLNNEIKIKCINTIERGVLLSLKNTTGDKSKSNGDRFDLGNTSYYPPFMGKSSQLSCLNFSLTTDFDKSAVNDKGCLDISFVDSDKQPLTYEKFKIVVNESDTLSTDNPSYPIKSGQEQINFTILPSENTDDSKFKGYLKVSNISNIDIINGEAISNDMKILPWEFEHDRKLNPLLRSIYWIIIFLLVLFIASLILYWFLWLRGAKFPRNWQINFDSIKGNPTIKFDCPNNKDYTFKGRKVFTHNAVIFFSGELHDFRINKVVLSNKTKCVWSYWNGYSIYIKTNLNDLNNSIKSITFTPVKGKLAIVEIKYLNRTGNEVYKEDLNYRDCDNKTNRINTNIQVDIFGEKTKY